ncbi:hypothetical protein F4821DRAFT_221193 [Hypoxylon rubiginosum]|uniref:Uncharacterized protein n=1 Tax=Hypoxylon rubiginosum TaxID=110542 RepID=A0ACC0DMS2_9PEZI|nr:hypothetical protein F4821DRAFT_221193 [Hypoxylon rubiginosum]
MLSRRAIFSSASLLLPAPFCLPRLFASHPQKPARDLDGFSLAEPLHLLYIAISTLHLNFFFPVSSFQRVGLFV